MKRIDLYVTEDQDKWLIEKTKKLGLSGKSELVRRVIDVVREGGKNDSNELRIIPRKQKANIQE